MAVGSCGLYNICSSQGAGELLWLNYVTPEGHASPSYHKIVPLSLSLHVVLPSQPTPAQSPWGDTKIIP